MKPNLKIKPEIFWVKPTPYAPNSRLPVIVYRGAIEDTSEANILSLIEPNGWPKGGRWKTFKIPHFHSNVHECYGIIYGSRTYKLGSSPLHPDVDEAGNPTYSTFWAQAGDVFILPVSSRPIYVHFTRLLTIQ